MRNFTTPLGEGNVDIYAPNKVTFDPQEFRAAFPSGQVYGLDVESTAMGDLGQFDPDFRIKLIQFATRDHAWVLDISDPRQRDAAVGLLSDVTVRFCSHTNMDVLAVYTQLNVDITRRNIDTRILAVMAAPTDALGGKGLKVSATKYGMPQLEEAETVMHARFKEIWCAHVDDTRKQASASMEACFGRLWASHCRPLFTGKDEEKRAAKAAKDVHMKLKKLYNKHGTEGYQDHVNKMWEDLGKILNKFEDLRESELRKLVEEYLVEQADAFAKTNGLTKTFDGKAAKFCWNVISVDDETYLMYAGLDAIACRRLLDVLIPLTKAPALLIGREMWLAGAANRIQIRGARVDQPLLNELHRESQEATDRANAVVQELTGHGVRQTAKLVEWFGERGADWTDHPKTKGGAPSLAKESLALLGSYPLDEDAKAALPAMLDAQKCADALMKTQGVLNALCPDGRVRSTLNTVGTVTSRMSSSGPNMQNFSTKDPRVRGMFIPEPGCVLIACDFAQIELRVAAALSGEQSMIDVIKAGGDLHQLTADLIGSDRNTGKTTNFQVLYGGGARAVSQQAGIPWEVARKLVYRFWESYPNLAEFNRRAQENTEIVRTISHRRIPVGTTKSGELRLYANLNYLIQPAARELIVGAWQRFDQEGYGDMIWGLIHDEMVLQVPKEKAQEVMDVVERCMTANFHDVPIKAEAKVLMDANGVSRWGK